MSLPWLNDCYEIALEVRRGGDGKKGSMLEAENLNAERNKAPKIAGKQPVRGTSEGISIATVVTPRTVLARSF
jgi:hypothetical protein